MTFAAAIDWVSKQDNCSRSEAIRQIRQAVADKAITGLGWDDQRSGMYAVRDSRPDYPPPPTDREFWPGEASIPDEKGRIFDPQTKRRRTLLIPKQSIFQYWPEPSAASEGSESGKAGPTTKAKRRGRFAEIEIHQALDQLFQPGLNLKGMSQKARAQLVNKKCSKEFDIRTVQKYFRNWLENHRTD